MGSQNTVQDGNSGLPTSYGGSIDNFLSWDSLGSEQVGRNGKKMLHPFAALKFLYNDLGATQ